MKRSLLSGMRGVALALFAAAVGVSCAGRPTLVPPSDPALRKTSAQFAADAAKRSYKIDAPRGGEAVARGEVNYVLNLINLVNLSDEDWSDVEVWVNRHYVVFVPKLARGVQTTLNFQMIYDDQGQSFPTKNKTHMVQQLEVYREGKMYNVPTRLPE